MAKDWIAHYWSLLLPNNKVGARLVVSGGGYDFVSSVQNWTASRWVELEENMLGVGWFFHAAVCIKTGIIFVLKTMNNTDDALCLIRGTYMYTSPELPKRS